MSKIHKVTFPLLPEANTESKSQEVGRVQDQGFPWRCIGQPIALHYVVSYVESFFQIFTYFGKYWAGSVKVFNVGGNRFLFFHSEVQFLSTEQGHHCALATTITVYTGNNF